MLRILRQCLCALIAFAIVGGTTTQLARSASFVAPMTMAAGMPCDMMAPTAGAGHGKPMTPCKGMTPGCIKQMGCVADIGLPAQFVGRKDVLHFSTVDYLTTWSRLAGLVSEPEPLPPRTT
ncbi:MAG: hypothetical protein J0H99_14045 [Rhodospirillales bacterium]|nr:hypothetical protein [Rhodospirillales bacterium]